MSAAPVGLQQRVLPDYRAPFCDALAQALPGGLAVFAGQPGLGESIRMAASLGKAQWTHAANLRIGAGPVWGLWQRGWRAWLEAVDPAAIVMEANPRYLTNYLIRNWMRARGRPVLGWSLGPGSRTGGRYYRAFDALIAYSRAGADGFRALGIPPQKVFVAPNAVEAATAERLMADPHARTLARRELGLGAGPVALFVGRLQARKRADLLLRANARAGSPWTLLLVGDGPDRPRLERIAMDQAANARLLGDLRGDALGACFLASDLFVMPGTGGLALQQALAYGLPAVVAEADGSQRDLVRAGENGWLLPAGDERALADLLRELSDHPEQLRRMGKASRRIVRETATMEKMVDGFQAALRAVSAT